MVETAVGVDIGGTRIRAARIDPSGRIVERVIETVKRDAPDLTSQVLRMIGSIRGESRGVGIGIPGRVDPDSARILSAGHLNIAGLDLCARVERETGLACRLENDATMALMAEAREMSGLVLMMTVGTGIGGAAVLDGRPWYGGSLAGQFGHLVVAADGPVCKCGGRGCVETFSSGAALGDMIEAAGLPPETRIEELLDDGASARALLLEWAQPFRRALDTLVAAFGPREIIVGGGLGGQMIRAVSLIPGTRPWFPLALRAAKLGDDAGVIGAGLVGHRVAGG